MSQPTRYKITAGKSAGKKGVLLKVIFNYHGLTIAVRLRLDEGVIGIWDIENVEVDECPPPPTGSMVSGTAPALPSIAANGHGAIHVPPLHRRRRAA